MALHNIRGKEGEQLAAEYLQRKDFEILTCNWRHRHYEIDIVAVRDDVLHFVEVKTRHSLQFGYPEESVSKKKFSHLKKGAEYFLQRYPAWKRVQFDILSVSILKNKSNEFFLIEDVYL